MPDLPYAEDTNYWQTSRSSPDQWLDRAAAQVEKIGGQVLMRGLGTMPDAGESAYILVFEIDGDSFRIVWPVLPTKKVSELKIKSARRQAATFIFYDVKARCLASTILGARTAFFSFILLADGRVASEAKKSEFVEFGSALFGQSPPLIEGEILD